MQDPSVRRDLAYFLLGPALVALAVAGLFQLHPWPTALKVQADTLAWLPTLAYLAAGAAGAAVSSRAGAPGVPPLGDRRWHPIVGWGLGVGLVYGCWSAGLTFFFTPLGAHNEALDRANGYTWANVALPWSPFHYAHAAILSECAFRLAAILIPAWLIGRLLLKGRREAAVFWTFGVLAALIEPIEKAILVKRLPLVGMPPLDIALTLEGVAWQIVYAWLLRRWGWPAPIIARFAWYLIVRVSAGYLLPPDAIMYPGPH